MFFSNKADTGQDFEWPSSGSFEHELEFEELNPVHLYHSFMIFEKFWGGVNRRFDIFMEVFEVGDHPLWMVTALFGDNPLSCRPARPQGGATPLKEKEDTNNPFLFLLNLGVC